MSLFKKREGKVAVVHFHLDFNYIIHVQQRPAH